jgi:hypothetical protein
VQFINQPDQKHLLFAPNRVIGIAACGCTYLLGLQAGAIGEERYMHAPLIAAATACASTVDHDLTMPQRYRPAVEQAPGTEAS